MDKCKLCAGCQQLHEAAEELAAGLKRISFAKADQLDHEKDIGIIERVAKVATRALAAYREKYPEGGCG